MIQRKKLTRTLKVLGRILLDIRREKAGATFTTPNYPDDETLYKLGLAAIGEVGQAEVLEHLQIAARRDTGVKRLVNAVLTSLQEDTRREAVLDAASKALDAATATPEGDVELTPEDEQLLQEIFEGTKPGDLVDQAYAEKYALSESDFEEGDLETAYAEDNRITSEELKQELSDPDA